MKKSSKDAQLAEFEQQDLGEAIRKSKSAVRVNRSYPTSILLPPTLVQKLKVKASKRGIGYQTMLKIILSEQVEHY